MVFPQFNYRQISVEDCKDYKDWCKQVNKAVKYCNNLPLVKYMEFEGKCKVTQLPSVHPYWKVQVLLDKKKDYIKHLEKYNICKDNLFLIKVYYNKHTSLDEIKNKIEKLYEEIKELKTINLL